MFSYIWPIILVIVANTFYHIVSKSTPANANPFASLTISYLISTVFCFGIYVVQSGGKNILEGFKTINWTSVALGVLIVGLEFGWMMSYRNGWEISKASIVANVALAVILLAVGCIFYKDEFTFKKVAGAALCIGGIVLLNV